MDEGPRARRSGTGAAGGGSDADGSGGERVPAIAGLDRRHDAATRREAAAALGNPSSLRIDGDRVVEALFAAALDDPDEGVRATAIESLYFHDDDHVDRLASRIAERRADREGDADGAAATFARWLESDRAAYRMVGATGLGTVGGEGAASRLRGAFDDDDARVRARSVRGYARVGGEAVDAVRPLLRTPNDLVRRAAVDALVAMDDDDATALLALAGREGNERLRLTVVRRLGGLDRGDAVGALLGRLRDPSEAVRRAAAASVAETIAAADAVPAGEVRDRLAAERPFERDGVLAAFRAAAAGNAPTAGGTDRVPSETRRYAAWLCCELVEAADPTAADLSAAVGWLVDALDGDDRLVADLAAAYLPRIAAGDAGRDDAEAGPEDALGVDVERELRALAADETASEAGRERARAVLRRFKREVVEAAADRHVEYVYVRWPADYTEKHGE